jgi:hypothetical protein
VTWLGVAVPVAGVVAAGALVVAGGWLVRRLGLPTDPPPAVGYEPEPVAPCDPGPGAAERAAVRATQAGALAHLRAVAEAHQLTAGAADAEHLTPAAAAVIRAAAAEIAGAQAELDPRRAGLRASPPTAVDAAAIAAIADRVRAARDRAQEAWDSVPDPAMRRRWLLAGALLASLALCAAVVIAGRMGAP